MPDHGFHYSPCRASGSGSALLRVGALVVVAGATVAAIAKDAAHTASELAVIAPAVGGTVLVGAIAAVVFVRSRRPRGQDGQPAITWQANPYASPLPARQAPAIAPAPQVVVNIDAGLLAGLMNAMQQQAEPVRAIPVQAEKELPR